MSDEAPLSREQMSRFLERIEEPFNEAEQQKRRSVEVSAGFFEKVAALSAGSTAILASLILAIANKYDIHAGWTQILVHHFLRIAFALGASLILAVLHNFFAALVARADAAIAESQLLQRIIAESLPFVHETTPQVNDATVTQVEEMMRAQMSPQFRRQLKSRTIFYTTATWVGSLSMVAFIVAFSLVIKYLWQLW
ncbi:MAG TPA: hypothetical protein VG225_14965 [Terracidiphilus sp.]|jgi:hypothetical protein|nr:hypothetical protein [Terracidiphilus sp.]